MKSEKKNSALSAGIGYTIGNILIKGINILTLPIFSRLMTADEFGVYNVFVSYDSILFMIIGLALHTSIRSANLEFRGEIDHYTSSVTLIYLLLAGAMTAVVMMFGNALSNLLGFDEPVLYLLILFSAASAFMTLYNTRISLDYSYKQYLLVAGINSVANIALSLILMLTVFRSHRDLGRILGITVVAVALAVAILVSLYRKARPRFVKQYWRFGLKYSLPIVPHGISQVLLAQFDRIMIRSLVNDAAAGIYSLASNVKLILTVITTSISSAWSTWFYGEMDQGNRDNIRKRATQLSALYSILTIGVMALSPELIMILGGEAYESAKYVVVPMVLDAFLLFLYDLVATGEYYAKKTIYIMAGTVVAAILNVVLNYIFILKFGFVAAAYTTLASYVCYLVLHVIISRRFTGFCIVPMKWMLLLSAVVIGMAAVNLLFMESLLLRWGACAIVVAPMALLLIRSAGGGNIKGMLKGK